MCRHKTRSNVATFRWYDVAHRIPLNKKIITGITEHEPDRKLYIQRKKKKKLNQLNPVNPIGYIESKQKSPCLRGVDTDKRSRNHFRAITFVYKRKKERSWTSNRFQIGNGKSSRSQQRRWEDWIIQRRTFACCAFDRKNIISNRKIRPEKKKIRRIYIFFYFAAVLLQCTHNNFFVPLYICRLVFFYLSRWCHIYEAILANRTGEYIFGITQSAI